MARKKTAVQEEIAKTVRKNAADQAAAEQFARERIEESLNTMDQVYIIPLWNVEINGNDYLVDVGGFLRKLGAVSVGVNLYRKGDAPQAQKEAPAEWDIPDQVTFTPGFITQLRQLAGKRAAGKWQFRPYKSKKQTYSLVAVREKGFAWVADYLPMAGVGLPEEEDNRAFIALAVNLFSPMLDEIERLNQQLTSTNTVAADLAQALGKVEWAIANDESSMCYWCCGTEPGTRPERAWYKEEEEYQEAMARYGLQGHKLDCPRQLALAEFNKLVGGQGPAETLSSQLAEMTADRDSEQAWASHYHRQLEEANRDAFDYKARWEMAAEFLMKLDTPEARAMVEELTKTQE